eukprot:scaffold39894_cov61-Phaeocystis_antarctica.AAC.2
MGGVENGREHRIWVDGIYVSLSGPGGFPAPTAQCTHFEWLLVVYLLPATTLLSSAVAGQPPCATRLQKWREKRRASCPHCRRATVVS